MKWERMEEELVEKGGKNKYIAERNGRSSWELQGIVAFCTCQWNEWIFIHHCWTVIIKLVFWNKCWTVWLVLEPAVPYSNPSKRWYLSIRLLGITSQTTTTLILTVTGTSNLRKYIMFKVLFCLQLRHYINHRLMPSPCVVLFKMCDASMLCLLMNVIPFSGSVSSADVSDSSALLPSDRGTIFTRLLSTSVTVSWSSRLEIGNALAWNT